MRVVAGVRSAVFIYVVLLPTGLEVAKSHTTRHLLLHLLGHSLDGRFCPGGRDIATSEEGICPPAAPASYFVRRGIRVGTTVDVDLQQEILRPATGRPAPLPMLFAC